VLVVPAVGQRPRAGQAHGTAAAQAVAGLAKTLAQELAEHRIRVNVLSCSAGDSAGGGDTAPGVDSAPAVGDMLAFLVSDAARHLTGIVLPADAGALV
jgi:NAD(P)-dependent dehydrogenase (short-subunit alcohol dehydrogenase family)